MRDYLEHLQKQGDNEFSLKRKIEYIRYNFGKHLSSIDKNSKILSIGPGIGALEAYMNIRGVDNIDVIDNDDSVLNYVRNKFRINNIFNSENIVKIKNKLQKYDYIFLIQVFEHIPQVQYKSFLTILVDSLKKDGKIFIVVPNGGNPLNLLERYHDLQHVSSFTEDSLKELSYFCDITDAKFEVESYNIPLSSVLDFVRIILQRILHNVIMISLVINGGVYQRSMTPNISLIITKK